MMGQENNHLFPVVPLVAGQLLIRRVMTRWLIGGGGTDRPGGFQESNREN